MNCALAILSRVKLHAIQSNTHRHWYLVFLPLASDLRSTRLCPPKTHLRPPFPPSSSRSLILPIFSYLLQGPQLIFVDFPFFKTLLRIPVRLNLPSDLDSPLPLDVAFETSQPAPCVYIAPLLIVCTPLVTPSVPRVWDQQNSSCSSRSTSIISHKPPLGRPLSGTRCPRLSPSSRVPTPKVMPVHSCVPIELPVGSP